MEEKEKLRQEGLRLLKEMPQTDKLHIEHRLAEQLFASPVWKDAKSIGLTMALPHEWDTTKLIQQGWLERRKYVYRLPSRTELCSFTISKAITN